MKEKTNFLYVLLISMLFFGCKHDTSKCPECPECPKVGTEATISSTTNKFIALSDVHVDGDLTETTFGSNTVSVTSEKLWLRTKAKIELTACKESPKFMVYLGDLPGYDDTERIDNTHLMLENLRNLEVDFPILYLPGNNDSLEGDYHSFSNSAEETVLTKDEDKTNPWPVINSGSSTIKVTNLDDTQKAFGYYSVDLVDGANTLKVIALNTVIFCAKGKYHRYVDDDKVSQQNATQAQMAWLEGKLKGLAANDRVLIMMHIPPGIDGYDDGSGNYSKMWNDALTFTTKDSKGKKVTYELQDGFIQLLSDHKSNIVGMLNGHTHLDGLRRVYNSTPKQKPEFVTYSITTPGIAVNHNNNPGFKMFTYDSATFDLLDFKTYYASPTNTAKNGEFQYAKGASYTFRDAYSVKDATKTIRSVIENMSTDDLVKNMGKTIGVKSNKDVNNNMNLDTALTVYKQK